MTLVNLKPEQKVTAQQQISQRLQVIQRQNARVTSNPASAQRISTALGSQGLPTPLREEFAAHRSLTEGLALGGDASKPTNEYLGNRGIVQNQKSEAKKSRMTSTKERTDAISHVLENDAAVSNINENFQKQGFWKKLFGDNNTQTAIEAHTSLHTSATKLGGERKTAGERLRATLGITDKTQFRDPEIKIDRQYDSATGKTTEIKHYTFVKGDGTVVKASGNEPLAQQYEGFQDARFAHEEAKERLNTFETEAKNYFGQTQLKDENKERVNKAFSELTTAQNAERDARAKLATHHAQDGSVLSPAEYEQAKASQTPPVSPNAPAPKPSPDKTEETPMTWLGATTAGKWVRGVAAGLGLLGLLNWIFNRPQQQTQGA